MKKYFHTFYFILVLTNLFGQTQQDSLSFCSTPHIPMSEADHKAYVKAMTENLQKYRNLTDSIVIPIVVHNAHWYHIGYVDDKAIVETIDQINDALANRGEHYDSLGIDTKIRLCLAGTDTEGNPTTGILHPHHELAWNRNYFNIPDLFTPEIQWDTTQYLNIYIADCWNGISSYPWSDNISKFDGFIVHTNNMTVRGGIGVFVHEIGHYLGLYHTFGQTNNNGICMNHYCHYLNDEVCDTPPHIFAYTPNFPINSCNTDVTPENPLNPLITDQLDMIDNYMTGGRWQSRFTQGQVDRMHWVLETYRPNLAVTETDNRCSNCKPIEVVAKIPNQEQLVGEEFIIENKSEAGLLFNWYIDGELISTQRDLSYIPTDDGFKIIRLEGYRSDDLECQETWTWEQGVNFTCQTDIGIEEPLHYFLDSCYSIATFGMDNLNWTTPYGSGNFGTIDFCPTVSGIQAIHFIYGEGTCVREDSILVNVHDITSLENRFWREQTLFEDNTYTPNVLRSRKINGNRLVFLGREDRPSNKIKQRAFFRFSDNNGKLKEEWQLYHPDSTVFYIPNDFIVDSLGNIYILSLLKHISSTSGKCIITKINRLGIVEWCKQINMPNHIYHRIVGFKRRHLAFDDEDILLELFGYYLKINKDGELIESYGLERLPYDKYEEYDYEDTVVNLEDENTISFFSGNRLKDFSLYTNYNEFLGSTINIDAFLVGQIDKQDKSLKYKYYSGPISKMYITDASITAKKHPNGLIGYWTNSGNDLYSIVLFDDDLEIVWQKVYRDNYFEGIQFHDDADIFVQENGDIHIYNTVNYGAYLIYFHFNKSGDLMNHYVIENEQNELLGINNVILDFHESGLMIDDGFLTTSSLLTDSTAKLIIQHLPLDKSYFSCDTISGTLEEVMSYRLTESYLSDSLKITPVEVSLQDAEIYIQKGTFETEVWCEVSYPLEDYSIKLQDTIFNCPDNMTISMEICRKKSDTSDTISLVQYPLSPLDTITSPSDIREVIFEVGQTCIREEWTTSVNDHHFMVNTRLDYLTPYTLEASFFDAHEKLEFEYRNNYVLVEGDCQMVATSDIELTNRLKVFPNPTSKDLSIELDQGLIQQVKLYTVLGELVKETVLGASKGTLSVEQLTNGIYLLEVQTQSGQDYWRKVIIQ